MSKLPKKLNKKYDKIKYIIIIKKSILLKFVMFSVLITAKFIRLANEIRKTWKTILKSNSISFRFRKLTYLKIRIYDKTNNIDAKVVIVTDINTILSKYLHEDLNKSLKK